MWNRKLKLRGFGGPKSEDASGRPEASRSVAGYAVSLGRRLLLSLGIVLVLFVNVGGLAQERPNGFYLASPLGLSAGYDNGFIANSEALDDTVVILTSPTFEWVKNTHRTSFSLDYQAEFEMFSRYQNLNAWEHSATLRYSYRIDSRLSFDAGDSFLSTTDASSRLADSQFLLPLGRFQQNSLFAGLKYRFSQRTQLFFRFDNAFTTMTLPAPLTNQFNLMTNAGTVTLDHTLTKHHSVTGSYSYVRVRPFDGNGSAGSSYPAVQTLNAGYLYTVNPGLLLRATGGVVRGPEFAYTAGGAVEKQLGDLWLMAGFQRYLSFVGGFAPGVGTANGAIPFADGLLPNSVFEAASLRVRGNLTKRVGLDFNGQMGRASVVGRGVRSLIGQARVDYKLNDRLTVFARAEYYGQNVSEFSSFPLSRSRYFGGLEIVLSRPPETDVASRRRQQIPDAAAAPQAEELQAPEEK
jgi:hypothetical protein